MSISDGPDTSDGAEAPTEPLTRTYMEFFVETFFRGLFFWESDEKRLGTLIRFFHHGFMICFFLFFLLTHTLFPSFFYVFLLWLTSMLIWAHHLVCGGCIVNRIERRFLHDTKSFIDPLLELFHIPIEDATTTGITIMASTMATFFLTLELVGRSVLNVQSWFRG